MTDVKRLLDEATPLPWNIETELMPRGGTATRVVQAETGAIVVPAAPHHAALIVYAVNHLPAYEAAVDALAAYVAAQGRMLDRWAEGDDAVKEELWRSLHACEEPARAALRRLRGDA